jgi:hypothetical protein
MNKKGLFLFLFLLVVVIHAKVNTAYSDSICVTFLKKVELMSGDSWSSNPLSSSDVIKNLSKYDAIWCAQLISKYNPKAWDDLRSLGEKQILLYYISGDTAKAGADDLTCLDYNYINRYHPEWFLLANAKDANFSDYKILDKRIRWNSANKNHPYYNRFFIDVGNKEFQKWAAQQMLEMVSGKKQNLTKGYSGLGMDNVALRALELSLTKLYPGWKYAGKASLWNQAYFDYLKVVHELLKAHGYIFVVNHTTGYDSNDDGTDWNTIMNISDGLMDEDSLGAPSNVFVNSRWLWTVKHHEATLAQGLTDWWVCRPAKDDPLGYEQYLYTYCTFLLTKKIGQSYYFASKGVSGYANSEVPWYKEYELPIGEPVSGRYLQGKCWVRDYQNAKIIVNPTEQIQNVVIGNQKYWYSPSDNKAIVKLDLKSGTGRILLPTPYPLKTNINGNN